MIKMAEFYAIGKRTAEADELAKQAGEIRAGALADSLRLRARLAAETGNANESENFGKRASRVLELAAAYASDQPVRLAPAKVKPLRRN